MHPQTRMKVFLLVLLIVAAASVTVVTLSGLRGGVANALALASEPASVDATIANCRYGAAPLDAASVPTISTLGAGWYLDFDSNPAVPPPANGAEFARMVKLNQRKTGSTYLPSYDVFPKLNAAFATSIKNKPGQMYILGNEVDRIGQGEMFPDIYARAYHDVYAFIKANDPTAQVAISGLVQVTPNRLQYLDLVWQSYIEQFGNTMPVDIWTMHLYVLPEVMTDGKTPNGIANVALGTDPTIGKRESGGNPAVCSDDAVYCFAEHDNLTVFAEQVVAMRQWMKDHGQQAKPLLLTEFSILYPYEIDQDGCFLQDENGNCFTPARINTFMTGAYNYLNSAQDPDIGYPMDGNRLIQRSMWFSVFFDQEGASSNLALNDRVTLTLIGQNFKNRVLAEGRYRNLVAEPIPPIGVALQGNSTVTATLRATFRNAGNEAISQPFKVSFYKDAALTQLIGSVDINPTITGCATLPYSASVSWPNLSKGVHNFWVHIDSGDQIPEVPANNGDNVAQGKVTVYQSQLQLPVVRGG